MNKSALAAGIAAAFLLPAFASATSLPPPAGYTAGQKIFEDTFSTPALDTTKWNPWVGEDGIGRWDDQGRLHLPLSGITAGGDQVDYYDPYPYGGGTNTTGTHLIGGTGHAALILRPTSYLASLGYSWAASSITTANKAHIPATGGYLQVHAMMPDSRYGAWAGIWLLSSNGAEMDLQESGYTRSGVNTNNLLAAHWNGNGGSQKIVDTGTDLSARYHTYGIEYKPGQTWTVYLDGKQMAQWYGAPSNAAYEVLLDLEMAGPLTTGWHTVADAFHHPGPFVFYVDDVQIYSAAASAGDTSAPSVPAGLTAAVGSGPSVALQWTASTDTGGAGLHGYDVYRDGSMLAFSAVASYTDKTVAAGQQHSYQVLAYDNSNNRSSLSSPVTVTIPTSCP